MSPSPFPITPPWSISSTRLKLIKIVELLNKSVIWRAGLITLTTSQTVSQTWNLFGNAILATFPPGSTAPIWRMAQQGGALETAGHIPPTWTAGESFTSENLFCLPNAMLQSIETFLKVYIQRGWGQLQWADAGDGQLQQVRGGREDGAHHHHCPRGAQRLEHGGDGGGDDELLRQHQRVALETGGRGQARGPVSCCHRLASSSWGGSSHIDNKGLTSYLLYAYAYAYALW